MDTKICLATLSNRGIKPKTWESWMNLDCPYPKHPVIAGDGYTISENRIYIAIQAIKNGCTHLLSIDDDQIFPPDTLTKLMSHKKEIIGCDIKSKVFPLQSHVELLNMKEVSLKDRLLGDIGIPNELFECNAIGFGVILIDLSVFKKMEKPWFDTETYETGMTKMGEDYWFCRQAKKAGYKIWCDPTLKIGHLGDYNYI